MSCPHGCGRRASASAIHAAALFVLSLGMAGGASAVPVEPAPMCGVPLEPPLVCSADAEPDPGGQQPLELLPQALQGEVPLAAIIALSPGTDTSLCMTWEPTIAVDPNNQRVIAVAQFTTIQVSFDGDNFPVNVNAPAVSAIRRWLSTARDGSSSPTCAVPAPGGTCASRDTSATPRPAPATSCRASGP